MSKVWMFAVVALASAAPSAGEGACTGEACSALSVSADGCQWKNQGSKAVRLSLSSTQAAPFVTILAPGDSFKQTDKGRCLASGGHFEASYPALRVMPEEDANLARPRPKPTMVAQTAPAATPTASVPPAQPVVESAAVAVASGPVLPRSKPQAPSLPPAPRAKPVVNVAVAETPDIQKPAGTALSGTACVEGDRTCPPILFKVIDSCVWVLNLNPRPVTFEALVGGKALALALEGADGAKADANRSTTTTAAMHMRLRDPFQSAGSGIPIYRARLGGAGDCVHARADITAFTARYQQ